MRKQQHGEESLKVYEDALDPGTDWPARMWLQEDADVATKPSRRCGPNRKITDFVHSRHSKEATRRQFETIEKGKTAPSRYCTAELRGRKRLFAGPAVRLAI